MSDPRTTCLAVGLSLLALARSSAQEATPSTDAKAPRAEGAAGPEADRLARVLGRAAEALKTMDDGEGDGPAARLRALAGGIRGIALRMEPELKARALAAVAAAQARLGAKEPARQTAQDALDAAGAATDADERAAVLREIAAVQVALGDRSEALATLQQALRSARLVKEEASPFPRLPGMGGDSAAKRATALAKIAEAQAAAGDAAAAQATLRQATQAADAIKDRPARVAALVEVARLQGSEAGAATRKRARELALAATDEHQKGRALRPVLADRARGGEVEPALAGLEGDLRAFAIWILADAAIRADRAVAARMAGPLRREAEAAHYDRPSKRLKVVSLVAEALARGGDIEGALQVVESLNDPTLPHYRYLVARAGVQRAIARERSEAGDLAAARRALADAIESTQSVRDEDGLAGMPWHEIAEEAARAGDTEAATRTAEGIGSAMMRVEAFTRIASARAGRGDRAAARAAISRAAHAADEVANDALWDTSETDLDIRPHVARLIVVARARAGDLDGALKGLAALRGGEQLTQRFELLQGADEIATALSESGDAAGALKALDAIPGEDPYFASERAERLEKVARAQAAAGGAEKALEWALRQDGPKARAYALLGIARGIAAPRAPGPKETAKPRS